MMHKGNRRPIPQRGTVDFPSNASISSDAEYRTKSLHMPTIDHPLSNISENFGFIDNDNNSSSSVNLCHLNSASDHAHRSCDNHAHRSCDNHVHRSSDKSNSPLSSCPLNSNSKYANSPPRESLYPSTTNCDIQGFDGFHHESFEAQDSSLTLTYPPNGVFSRSIENSSDDESSILVKSLFAQERSSYNWSSSESPLPSPAHSRVPSDDSSSLSRSPSRSPSLNSDNFANNIVMSRPRSRRPSSAKKYPPPVLPELLTAVKLRTERLNRPTNDIAHVYPSNHQLASNLDTTISSVSIIDFHHSSTLSITNSTSSTINSTPSDSLPHSRTSGEESHHLDVDSSSFENPCSVSLLPPEVWLTIFSYLSPSTLVTLHTAFSTWAEDCWETVTSLNLSEGQESLIPIEVWLEYIPKMSRLKDLCIPKQFSVYNILQSVQSDFLQSVGIHCDSPTNFESLSPLIRFSSLRSLSLWLSPHVPPSAVQPLFKFMPQLECLKIETLRQKFCEKALQDLEMLKSLRVLDLSWCKQLNPHVLQRISKLTSLETLILDMCGDDVTVSGLSCMQSLPLLSELSLKWCENVTDAVLPTLALFKSLKKLDVSFCRLITSQGVAIWLPNVVVIKSTHSPKRRFATLRNQT